MERTFRLTIGYDGTEYAGWQIQPNGPTIQGKLETAFHQLTGKRGVFTGSGRTDSGVHAIAQVASVTTDAWRDRPDSLARALNTKLPQDISIFCCEEMPLGFHALRDTIGKRYRYQMQVGGVRDAFDFRYAWHIVTPLNIHAMRDAATRIVGRHDFACFQATGSDRKTTVRNVRALTIEQEQGRGEASKLTIEVEADGFLYNMVRNIVGTLVEVGRGKHSATWIEDLIASKDRNQAGPTAPAHGLFLLRVDYDS